MAMLYDSTSCTKQNIILHLRHTTYLHINYLQLLIAYHEYTILRTYQMSHFLNG